MSLVNNPGGFRPIFDQSGDLRPARLPNGIANGFNQSIYKYQPIMLNTATGLIQPITSGTVPIYGVFDGVEYCPLGQRPVVSPYWPAGTLVDTSCDFLVYFWPAWIPGYRFAVQADGQITQAGTPSQGGYGSGYATTNITANYNPIPGYAYSQATIGAAGVPAGTQAQWTLIDATNAPSDNFATDPYSTVRVICAYPQVGPGLIPSIG